MHITRLQLRSFDQSPPTCRLASRDSLLSESVGHHRQWIDACKSDKKTGSPFSYAGPFTEVVLLGNVAYRIGETINYDPTQMKITNIARANDLLSKQYRTGWEI